MFCSNGRQVPSTFAMVVALLTGVCALSQDTRKVTEPVFPPTCAEIAAPLETDEAGMLKSAEDTDAISSAETATIQSALYRCGIGKAVDLMLGTNGKSDAFLINPLTVPAGVSLIVDGGVTVFGGANPAKYQVPGSRYTCGVSNAIGNSLSEMLDERGNGGCKALLNFSSNTGLFGYGVVDGRGYARMLSGSNAGQTWWSQTATLKHGQMQNIPTLIRATGDNFTAYKITLRNAPFYHLHWMGDGLTVWGVKISAPWNLLNSDGIDVWGTNATVKDATISQGDDQVAIDSWTTPAGNITIDHLTGYSTIGVAIGSGIVKGVSKVLVRDSDFTGGVVSLKDSTVNGMTFGEMKEYGVTDYRQALPTTSGRIRGFNIKTRAQLGGSVEDIKYSDICMQDINTAMQLRSFSDSDNGTNYPTVRGITYRNIHLLPPTSMGVPRYAMNFKAFVPEIPNQITFDNVVFDDLPSDESSLQTVIAIDDIFATKNNVYPGLLNRLDADSPIMKTAGAISLNLGANSYSSRTRSVRQSNAYGCPANPFPFLAGDLYVSATSALTSGTANNMETIDTKLGSAVTLHAIVQPAMSEITYFTPSNIGANPGFLAAGAPRLKASIIFYKDDTLTGGQIVGNAKLAANGTLASFTVPPLNRGTHHFSAAYPGDAYYGFFRFGAVTVVVK